MSKKTQSKKAVAAAALAIAAAEFVGPVAPVAIAYEAPTIAQISADRADEMTGAEAFETPTRRSSGIAKSWADPETRKARMTRHAVECDGVTYESLEKAFKALGLPMAKFIGFRKDLKAYGEQSFGSHDFKLVA